MPKGKRLHRTINNVVSVYFDAAFYFERGLRSFHRNELHKALRYFKRCVALDENNPKYITHLAALHTERGEYEESNCLLSQVVHHIDDTYTECYYYMANNFAHLGDFDQAEQYALMYLTKNKEGLFSDEAEELLDFICFELDRAPKALDHEHQLISKHEKARHCLEEGKFVEATQILEQMIEEYPNFLAARNNVALAYYYLGHYDKALEVIQDILTKDHGNLHALCNLVVFYIHHGREDEALPIIEGLKKIHPIQIDHHYKLAMTLGIVGEDERAFELFLILARKGMSQDVSLLHYVAVAAFNTQRWGVARQYWNKAFELKPKDEIAPYYISLLDQQKPHGERPRLPYHYELPYDVQLKKRDLLSQGREFKEVFKDPLIRSSLFWSLRHGDLHTKLRVIQSFEFIADEEIEAALRELLLSTEEEEYIKRVALFVLRQIGAASPYEVLLGGQKVEIEEMTIKEHFPPWFSRWQKVMDALRSTMESEYDLLDYLEAERLWTSFVSGDHMNPPSIRKAEGWAAAIEYMIAVGRNKECTKKNIAERYGVSVQTLSKNLKYIEQSIQLDNDRDSLYYGRKE